MNGPPAAGHAVLVGAAQAFPPPIDQDEAWDDYFSRHFAGNRIAHRVFRSAGVRRRHTAVNPGVEDISGWSTEARMRRYVEDAVPLGKAAVAAALDDAGLAASDVGLFAVASCTGYATPGLDVRLARDLAMDRDVQRLFIGHMGCYAALPGLGVVGDFVVARGRPAVLLCVELTSVHLQPSTQDAQQVVAHALFSDAAAAVVLVPGPAAGLELLDVAARTDVATADHMTWDVTDLGFRMGLSPRVPDVLAVHVRSVVEDLLGRHGLDVEDVGGWAVHPGGPRILDVVAERLALPPDALTASRRTLAEHGNCSSATVLVVMDALARDTTVDGTTLAPGGHLVALAFGPGLTLYAALFRRTPHR